MTTDIDLTAAAELRIYIDNDGELYRQRGLSIQENLRRKWKNGQYNADLAPKLWLYLVNNGARKYQREYGSSTCFCFPLSLRRLVAREMAESFYQELRVETGVI